MSSYTITKAQLAKLIELTDVDPMRSLRGDYSGRGMFGKTCFGFEPEESGYGTGCTEAQFIAALAMVLDRDDDALGQLEVDAYELMEAIGQLDPSHDSMGRGTIVYFRRIDLADDARALLDEDYAETF